MKKTIVLLSLLSLLASTPASAGVCAEAGFGAAGPFRDACLSRRLWECKYYTLEICCMGLFSDVTTCARYSPLCGSDFEQCSEDVALDCCPPWSDPWAGGDEPWPGGTGDGGGSFVGCGTWRPGCICTPQGALVCSGGLLY